VTKIHSIPPMQKPPATVPCPSGRGDDAFKHEEEALGVQIAVYACPHNPLGGSEYRIQRLFACGRCGFYRGYHVRLKDTPYGSFVLCPDYISQASFTPGKEMAASEVDFEKVPEPRHPTRW